ncbi:MAG: SUMF1/EgtB/PvdO family nonheme iron enzyme [Treponemataceae bacterium]
MKQFSKKFLRAFALLFLCLSCRQQVEQKLDITYEGKTIKIGDTTMTMVDIEGGHFILGESGVTYNPEHNVELSDYQIAETEITQKVFEAVMGYNPSEFNSNPPAGEIQELRPADRVNWYEAVEFCNKLTEVLMGKEHCVYTITNIERYSDEDGIEKATVQADWSKKGFRLPTEAEWEWAARCGDDFKHAGSNELTEVAWCASNSNGTHEVKKLKPNKFGLYDMTGNVWEWCWDLSGPIEDGADLGKDPKGAEHIGEMRSHRGACWYCPIPDTDGRYFIPFRNAFIGPDKKDSKIGFRIARYK